MATSTAITIERRVKSASVDKRKHDKRELDNLGYDLHQQQQGYVYGSPAVQPAPVYEASAEGHAIPEAHTPIIVGRPVG